MDDEVGRGIILTMRLSIGLTMLLCASACSSLWAADLHALDVKPGQWETTTTGQMTGMPAIPPEVLAKLTPEQRAKMESAMGARGAKPIVSTSCRTKEKLAQAWTTGQQKSCTTAVTSSSSTKQEVHLECNQDGTKSSGDIKVEVVDSEHIRGSFQLTTASDGNHTVNMNYSFTSKWLGGACTEASK
jgi:Protein of unknown function (DUF3617)